MSTGEDPLAESQATFSVREEDGARVLVVGGEIDVATSPELRHRLHQLLDGGASSITVDLSDTSFMDSSGLGVLVGVLKRLRDEQRTDALVLAGLQDPVRRVFDITGLTALFTIRD